MISNADSSISELTRRVEVQRRKFLKRIGEVEVEVAAVLRALSATTQTMADRKPNKTVGELANAIRRALPRFRKGDFTASELEEFMAKRPSHISRSASSYARCLMELVRFGEIELVKRGSGRRPTVFRKKPTAGVKSRRIERHPR